MKRKNKKTAGVFLLAVILIFVVLPAVSVDAAERKGSITVQLNEIGTDREGTALECFYVAEQKEKREIRQLKALVYFTDGDPQITKKRQKNFLPG